MLPSWESMTHLEMHRISEALELFNNSPIGSASDEYPGACPGFAWPTVGRSPLAEIHTFPQVTSLLCTRQLTIKAFNIKDLQNGAVSRLAPHLQTFICLPG
jgi:hypothetical protein